MQSTLHHPHRAPTRGRGILAAVAVGLVLASCSSDRASSSDNQPTGVEGYVQPLGTQTAFGSVTPVLTPRADLAPADAGEVHLSYAPEVPATITRSDQRVWEVTLEVVEAVCPLDPANGVTTLMWGYKVNGDDAVTCGTPGPVLRGRVGDIARITLINPATSVHPHNIDFHAVTGQGGGAADLTAAPGETKTIEARLLYPGAFMYHCAFGDVPVHIAHGMYGMFIVDPEVPLPPADHEWAVMQSEWYVTEPDAAGVAELDMDAMFAEEPRYVTFNGRTDALTGDNALKMQVGERARIYMVNEGLNLDSNWHPIGSHWDAVWAEAATHPSNAPIRGSQSTLVVAGGGTITDLIGQVPSTIILVDHALVRTFYKGAIGMVIVEGDPNAEIFSAGATDLTAGGSSGAPSGDGGSDASDEGAATPSTDPVETDAVEITEGAYLPDNAAVAYTPATIKVAAGTTVTWTNNDIIAHTVTSGTTDGRSGSPDGSYDSGNVEPGQTYQQTYDEPGTFTYFCVPHPWMTGTVIVE